MDNSEEIRSKCWQPQAKCKGYTYNNNNRCVCVCIHCNGNGIASVVLFPMLIKRFCNKQIWLMIIQSVYTIPLSRITWVKLRCHQFFFLFFCFFLSFFLSWRSYFYPSNEWIYLGEMRDGCINVRLFFSFLLNYPPMKLCFVKINVHFILWKCKWKLKWDCEMWALQPFSLRVRVFFFPFLVRIFISIKFDYSTTKDE